MRVDFRMMLVALATACGTPLAAGAVNCSGVLSDAEMAGFKTFFSPTFAPPLTVVKGDLVRVMTNKEFETLTNSTSAPLAKQTLTAKQAENLKGWLNSHAASNVPAWFSTVLGLANSLVGLIADLAVQWSNSISSDAQITAGNLAGRAVAGGVVGVVPGAAIVKGEKTYVWSYLYKVDIGGQAYVHLLYACRANVVIK